MFDFDREMGEKKRSISIARKEAELKSNKGGISLLMILIILSASVMTIFLIAYIIWQTKIALFLLLASAVVFVPLIMLFVGAMKKLVEEYNRIKKELEVDNVEGGDDL